MFGSLTMPCFARLTKQMFGFSSHPLDFCAMKVELLSVAGKASLAELGEVREISEKTNNTQKQSARQRYIPGISFH